jgi:hypothetical protein
MQDPKNLKHIDENSLIELAGKAAFRRGEKYHLQGRELR